MSTMIAIPMHPHLFELLCAMPWAFRGCEFVVEHSEQVTARSRFCHRISQIHIDNSCDEEFPNVRINPLDQDRWEGIRPWADLKHDKDDPWLCSTTHVCITQDHPLFQAIFCTSTWKVASQRDSPLHSVGIADDVMHTLMTKYPHRVEGRFATITILHLDGSTSENDVFLQQYDPKTQTYLAINILRNSGWQMGHDCFHVAIPETKRPKGAAILKKIQCLHGETPDLYVKG